MGKRGKYPREYVYWAHFTSIWNATRCTGQYAQVQWYTFPTIALMRSVHKVNHIGMNNGIPWRTIGKPTRMVGRVAAPSRSCRPPWTVSKGLLDLPLMVRRR